MLAMEEWGHADDRVIQRQYSEKVCISCAWFTTGWTLTATPALAAPLWRRCWSKGNTSLTAAATGSQCTKWKQVPLSRHEKAGCSSPRNPASTQIKSF